MGAEPRLMTEDSLSLQEIVNLIYEKYRTVDDGEVATYIPELSRSIPSGFAICVATVDGKVFCAGDWKREFDHSVGLQTFRIPDGAGRIWAGADAVFCRCRAQW